MSVKKFIEIAQFTSLVIGMPQQLREKSVNELAIGQTTLILISLVIVALLLKRTEGTTDKTTKEDKM